MASQDPEEWEFPLTQLPEDLSQPSTSRRRLRDEDESSERHVQPRLNTNPRQPPLTSLLSLQPGARALVIVLEAEALLIDGHQVVFEGCFENTNEVQMVTRLSDNIGHRLWLQGPLNQLDGERRAFYIAAVLQRILKFLHV